MSAPTAAACRHVDEVTGRNALVRLNRSIDSPRSLFRCPHCGRVGTRRDLTGGRRGLTGGRRGLGVACLGGGWLIVTLWLMVRMLGDGGNPVLAVIVAVLLLITGYGVIRTFRSNGGPGGAR